SLGVLAGGIAHDFNNLLTAIVGHLDLARRRMEPAHAAMHHLDLVEKAASRAADLTRQMLAYGGMGRFAVEPVDLALLVREMMALLRASISRRVAMSCELTERPATIEADRAQTQQVIMNLITNAAEAIGEAGGTIALRVGHEELGEEAAVRDFAGQGVAPGRKVKLEVEDSGHGMAPDVLARIFDPFFSTKSSGRGLGLSALRGILKAHGAGFRIRTDVGAGTSFQVYFPASDATIVPVTHPAVTSGAGAGTALLVDDETNVRISLRAVLEDLGFTVLEAVDGLDALEVYRACRDRIDWVLMDLTMPRMDGHEAFLRLRELDPDVVVILSSGWAEAEVLARFSSCAPAAVLSKPFTVQRLEATLARLGLMGAAPVPDLL
ncbi:MAG: response regulator, partial [Deltaproteobacteria bacterium]